ncbi:MAG: RNA 3'-terminal phosphate cyclase [Alphaproteobacteria bacterium]
MLRSTLTLSAITGRPVWIENIRAGRKNPGLAAQHVTSVRALAAICRARVAGDAIGATTLEFEPQEPVCAGDYAFDVGAARPGGSAGAAGLVLQAVLPPLALARGESRVPIRGGTHMAWSPPYDYLREVWLPALARIGIEAEVELGASGWFPIGKGDIRARVSGLGEDWRRRLRSVDLRARGRMRGISGRALAANLPAHIPERMAAWVRATLARLEVPVEIAAESCGAACAGAGIFLTADYEHLRCGFSALGERGMPAEQVAEHAVCALIAHWTSEAALDAHLGDQVLVPLALTPGRSVLSVERITRHLETNAWIVERFGLARIAIETAAGGTGLVTVEPAAR